VPRSLIAAVILVVTLVLTNARTAGAADSVQLREGWNLVTYDGSPMSAGRQARVLSARTGGETAIFVYDAGIWRGHHSSGPSFANALAVLVPGHEYWVYVEAETVWEFPHGNLDLIAFTLTGSVAEDEAARLGPGTTGPLKTAIAVIPPEGGPTATIASFDGLSGGFAWSSSGERMAWCSDAGLETAFSDGTGRARHYDGPCAEPAWSGGDRYIAFLERSDEGADIIRLEPATGLRENLTDDPAGNFEEPSWRPGTNDLYAVRRGSSDFSDDQVVQVGDGAVTTLLDEQPRRDLAFSPDGEYLYTTRQDGSEVDLRAFDLEDETEETVAEGGRALSASPDGRYLAWRDTNYLRVRPAAGGATLSPVVADRVHSHSWSPGSERLAVGLDDGVIKGALAVTGVTGPPEIIAHYPPLYVTGVTWSPR
jgi:hypothetical protein